MTLMQGGISVPLSSGFKSLLAVRSPPFGRARTPLARRCSFGSFGRSVILGFWWSFPFVYPFSFFDFVQIYLICFNKIIYFIFDLNVLDIFHFGYYIYFPEHFTVVTLSIYFF